MAITVKALTSWVEITTDNATVSIPGGLNSQDRMFLWVQWKDQSITLSTPSGWTNIDTFSDGSVATGNGAGSMRQQVFYRDWQSGDSAPALDFSTTTGLLAEAEIMVFEKESGDSWDTPQFRSAAWPSSSSQTVSASATCVVKDGAVVIAAIAIRDDSSTFTRGSTTGIASTGGAITWNGNYVEGPAAHYSTTTGNDHSGDSGYRLVTTGNSDVTLNVTATISNAETGSVVWIVQEISSSAPSGSGGVTLPAPAISGTGAAGASGTGSVTILKPTISGTATETFTGSGGVTLPAPTISGSGAAGASGSGGVTIQKPALAGTAEERFIGDAGLLIPAPAISGSGSEQFIGDAGITIQKPSIAATGAAGASGSAAVTIPAPAISGTGEHVEGEGASGSGGVTLPAPSISGTGTEGFTGSGGATLPAPAISGSGAEQFSGSGAATIPAPSIAGSGAEGFSGSGAVVVPAPAISGSGLQTENVSGSGGVTIPGPSISGFQAATPAPPVEDDSGVGRTPFDDYTLVEDDERVLELVLLSV